MSLGQKILTIDRRILYLIIALVTIIPLLSPIGLPIPISSASQIYYDKMEMMPDGSVVVMEWDVGMGRPVKTALMTDTLKYFLSKDIKVVCLAFDKRLEGGAICDAAIRKIDPERNFGKIYGVDYVNLGSQAGQIAAMSGFVEDSWAQFPTDNQGTPVQNLPIMEYMKSGADIDLIVCTGEGTHVRWITIAKQKYGTLIFAVNDAGEAKTVEPYIASGQVEAQLTDLAGAAEFELLIKQPGEGLKAMDPLNTILITECIFLIITNVVFLTTKDVKKVGGKN